VVACPKCGYNVKTPIGTWPRASNLTATVVENTGLVSIYECPDCKVRFRHTAEKHTNLDEKANVENTRKKIDDVRNGLMQTLINLHQRLDTLETERARVMGQIMRLRKAAESRAETLENEVDSLRNEVKSLRELLGYDQERTCNDQS
jgi:septal ring factor EnvC (AmiA/AmiB activator)